MKNLKNYLLESKVTTKKATLGEFFAWYITGETNWDDVNMEEADDILSSNDEPELNGFANAKEMIDYISSHKNDKVTVVSKPIDNCYENTIIAKDRSIDIDTVEKF